MRKFTKCDRVFFGHNKIPSSIVLYISENLLNLYSLPKQHARLLRKKKKSSFIFLTTCIICMSIFYFFYFKTLGNWKVSTNFKKNAHNMWRNASNILRCIFDISYCDISCIYDLLIKFFAFISHSICNPAVLSEINQILHNSPPPFILQMANELKKCMHYTFPKSNTFK